VKLALMTFGSAGDVHPMLALGQALQRRGHEVVLLSLPVFEAQALAAGLRFVPVGRTEDYEQTLAHPKLWHAVDGLGVMWRYLLRPVMQPAYEALTRLVHEGLDALVAPPFVLAARVASERWGTPLLSVYTAATLLRSTRWPVTVAAWRVPAGVPSWAVAGLWRVLDRLKLEPLVRQDVALLRGLAGLPPLQVPVFGDWMHSPDAGLALFPDWFARAADWPARVRHAGFMLYENDVTEGLPAHVDAFLQQGDAPLVFMPGTAQRFAAGFYEAAMAACKALGRRGILLGPMAPTIDDGQLCSAAYAPFSLLLGRARAVVHHGGVGTCAQALRAGVPQVIVPSAYDQFDNAMRLAHLGVGLSLPMARVNAQTLSAVLGRLLAQPAWGQRAQAVRLQMDVAGFHEQACLAVEALSA